MGIELPDPELFRLHAALAGVLHTSGAADIFNLIVYRRNPSQPPVPSADGEAFFKEIVEDNELGALRRSIAAMWSYSFQLVSVHPSQFYDLACIVCPISTASYVHRQRCIPVRPLSAFCKCALTCYSFRAEALVGWSAGHLGGATTP
ncbi:hypothetical protein BD309DRAFT_1067632, partial [Dichomitus squalens]